MKYDKKTIGKIIAKERKALKTVKWNGKEGKMSQEDLAFSLGYNDRKIIGKWETGIDAPSLSDMLKMCDLFECDLGHLLGEYPTKTKIATDIQEETGLSEDAINILRLEKKKQNDRLSTDSKEKHAIVFGKLKLIDTFIRNCEPIAEPMPELWQENFLSKAERGKLKGVTVDYGDALESFNSIYDNPSLTEYEKITAYIERGIEKMGWEEIQRDGRILTADGYLTEQDIKNNLYSEYMRFTNRRTNKDINYHRTNMERTFNQIIDSIIGDSFFEEDGKSET